MSSYCLEVVRTNLEESRTIDLPDAADVELGEGEAVIRVDRFGLTANNITYGVAGDIIGYWQFFPSEGEFGRIPVWGVGTVIRSGSTDLKEGDEYYGYYPMASYLVVKPEHVTGRGFTDVAAHRTALPPTYNQYSLMTATNGFDRDYDSHRMVYFPLFATGFILDDWLFDNDMFGAEKVIVSSASSKTSFSLGFLLNRNRDITVVGLTSSGNKAFVEGMGIYDEVVTYDDIEQMADAKVAFVDMAGNRKVLERLHHHFGDNVVCSSGVGITHWETRDGQEPAELPGAKPSMFFAPTQMQKRNQDWGPETYQAELQSAWTAFLGAVDDWVSINEGSGADAMETTYRTVLNGAKPDQAYVCVV
ncbi:MAG: DUF2855 family protein [Pseudomonadales bacterium]|nr:DUF2855 family protein [Pseudomonadales bacterium]